jgi:hypothetical protein
MQHVKNCALEISVMEKVRGKMRGKMRMAKGVSNLHLKIAKF